jgi:HlyD family secretion protein
VVALANLQDIQVELDIAQDDFAKLKSKQRALITVDAFPDHKYTGYIAEISPEANRQKATVQVKVQIENPDELLRPDMNATVKFLANEDKTAAKAPTGAIVPTSAVVDRNGKKVVFVAFNDKAVMREVHIINPRSGGYLVDGLVGGENVITGPAETLKDGDRIKIKGQTT